MSNYIPTGNELLSLPKINQSTGSIEDITFLSMQLKGMLEVLGSDKLPLFLPYLEGLEAGSLNWCRDHWWIPTATANTSDFDFHLTVLTPIKERGFALRFEIKAKRPCKIRWGVKGCIHDVHHCINEDKPLDGKFYSYKSNWNSGFIVDYRVGTPLFSLAPMTDIPCEMLFSQKEHSIDYDIFREEQLTDNQDASFTIFWGFGYEEVAAATSAKEMLRRGYAWEYTKTINYLKEHSCQMATPARTKLYNENLFFCLFYSTGICYDTEELICATSRSTRYYVSAAYWDRDTLLWAFPTILSTDKNLARQVLDYIYTRQGKNLGIHSRYIDGTVLEPGFELDELVAPILALHEYVKITKDTDILSEAHVKKGISYILTYLEEQKSPKTCLYETFLQPTDDERVYPYLTYDNVLVWKAFTCLAKIFPDKADYYLHQASQVKKSILENCVFENEHGKYYGWSVDLEGHHDIYDEPPGSLQLLPYYGFTTIDDEIWQNTVRMIRSPEYAYSFAGFPIAEIGCPHAPHPWVLSLCNSLLSGHATQAWKELELLKMDNGIACESVDETDGSSTTGDAFATCAGFLCHAMKVAEDMQL